MTLRTRSTSLSSPPCRADLITMPSLVWLWHLDRSAHNTQTSMKSNFICIDVTLHYPGLLFPNKKLMSGESNFTVKQNLTTEMLWSNLTQELVP